MRTPTEVVQRFIDEVIEGDLVADVECCARDAVVSQDGATTVANGREQIRRTYEETIDSQPGAHPEVQSRLAIGTAGVDQEHVTGLVIDGVATEMDAVFVYEVRDGVIASMSWFTP